MKARLLLSLLCVFGASAAIAGVSRGAIVPARTLLKVQLENSVGSDTSRVEDPVRARLVNPIMIGGRTVVPAGSQVLGTVTDATRAGRVKGRAHLALRFTTLAPAGDRERYRIATRTWSS